MRSFLLVGLLCAGLATAGCKPQERPTRKRLLARMQDARPAARIVAIKETAPEANREETAAIARAARDGTEDVREAVAAALGKCPDPSAVDLLGALLNDPTDAVRAAAVRALLLRKDPRAASYIAHAYDSSGPQTRAAVAEATPEIFRKAVATEASRWRKRVEEQRKDSHDQIRAQAMAELGRDATEVIVGELSSRLVDSNPTMAAAAAAGLAHANAVKEIPTLVQALTYPNELVVSAAAIALLELGSTQGAKALATALESAQGETAGHLLDTLEQADLNEAARASLCRTATAATDATLALRVARLAGPACAIPTTIPDAAPAATARLLVLAAVGHKDAEVRKQALRLLSAPDAHEASAAAIYLGRLGDPSDAALLVKKAQEELLSLRQARLTGRLAAPAAPPPEPQKGSLEAFLSQMDKAAGGHLAAQASEPPPLLNKLAQMLQRRKATDEMVPYEQRHGEIQLITSLALAGAQLGGSTDEAVAALLADTEPSVRLMGAEIAGIGDDSAEPIREKLRKDADSAIRLRTAILDWRAGRPGALEAITALAEKAEIDGRIEIASEAGAHLPEAKPLLLSLAAGSDAAVPVAVNGLAGATGEDVEQLLAARLDVAPELAGFEAIQVLSKRAGPRVDALLTEAAVQQSPDLREAAVAALIARKACSAAPRLAPLEADYSGVVRSRVAELQRLCSAPAAGAVHP
jgi:HEAT repeat protein